MNHDLKKPLARRYDVKLVEMTNSEGGEMERIGASEAKAHLSELLARVGYSGERFVVERRGKPVAALVGMDDFERLEGLNQRPRGAIALVGIWDSLDDDEIDGFLENVYGMREAETGRRVDLEA